MKTARWVSRGIGLLALVVIAAGCATPEPPLPPPLVVKQGDFKRLAGLWYGTGYVQEAAPLNIQAVIYEDGEFTVQERRLGATPLSWLHAHRRRRHPVRQPAFVGHDDILRDADVLCLEMAGRQQVRQQPSRDE